jgi:hypothetical protein
LPCKDARLNLLRVKMTFFQTENSQNDKQP